MELRRTILARKTMALGLSIVVAAGIGLIAADRYAVAEEGASSATRLADFTDRGTGLFPDVNRNDQYQNSGNRGCNACHEDLFDVDKDNGTFTHITSYAGLKDGSYMADCSECHHSPGAMTGVIMGDPIHVAHYSSNAFLAANGNCWSCHATTWDEDGQPVLKLFEEIMYEASYGGYPSADTDRTIGWSRSRGFETGVYTGISMDEAPVFEVALSQNASLEEDEFRILNFRRVDGDDAYAALEAGYADWTLEVTGVNDPRPLTLDDIKAMPSIEFTGAQWCLVNGINSAMVDNKPMKGVPLATFIDELGGLAEGANAYVPICADGWTTGKGLGVEDLIACGAVLVYENYGHDLTVDQGGPLTLFIPGTGGAVSTKNLVGLDFVASDAPLTVESMFTPILGRGMGLHLNSSWFDNDGVQATVGQTLALEGAAYGWDANTFDFSPVQIQFSFDYGRTWTPVDVPEDFDDDQWVRFRLDWTPRVAGTYILKMKAVDAAGMEQVCESNLIVIVNEA